MQLLLPQMSPESEQIVHALPFVPQAAFSPPDSHRPSALQQPVEQFEGLHRGAPHEAAERETNVRRTASAWARPLPDHRFSWNPSRLW
jgi:hypothetical protein